MCDCIGDRCCGISSFGVGLTQRAATVSGVRPRMGETQPSRESARGTGVETADQFASAIRGPNKSHLAKQPQMRPST